MVQLKACPVKRDVACLIFCLIIFPISLRLALFGLMSCLIFRIKLGRNRHQKLIVKTIFGIAIAIITSRLYIESLSLIHPVSYYDYLLPLAVVGIIKHSPLSIKSISQICWAISLSPLIVFICFLSILNLNVRNHWGFENPNWLGLYCSMCLPLTLCLLIESLYQCQSDSFKGQKSNLIPLGILTLVLVIICLMIVSSGSRSSFYTSLFISVIILWRSLMVNSISLLKYPQFIVCLGGLLLGAILFYKLLLTRFVELSRFVDIANSTNIYRIKLYKCHLALGIEKPWVGWGMNRVTVMCEQKLGAGEGGVNHAHNFILQLFADWGLVVTLLCLCAISYFSVLPTLSLIAKPNFNSANDLLHLGISGSSISILIASLFQSGFYHYPLFPIWLGLLWGCQLNLIEYQSCLSVLAHKQPNSRSLAN